MAPAVWPDCASKALVCTLNSAMASDGGEKPTTPLLFPAAVLLGETRLGAPSRVNSLPPRAPFDDDAGQVAVVHGPGEVEVRGVGDAGREARQHVGRAVPEGQLLDLVAVDHLPGDAGGVENGCRGHHLDHLGHPARVERQVHGDDVADPHLDAGAHRGLEPVHRAADGVDPGVQVAHLVVALGVRQDGGRHLRAFVGDHHRGPSQHGSRRVRYRARDAAAEVLGAGGRRGRHSRAGQDCPEHRSHSL